MRFSLVSLFTFLLLSVSGWTTAQSEEPCGTDFVHNAELSSVPYARNFDAVREAVQRLQASSMRNLEVYKIPVVVHVIHRGSPLGVDENISDEQIMSAIAGMNEDFRKKEGSLGDGDGVDTYIEFELAKRTPEGEPTNGIVRVNGNVVPGYAEHGISNGSSSSGEGADQAQVKALTTWYGEDYVNIFVVPEINGNDGGWGIQGFAYQGPTYDERDGIVVLYNTFGLVGELKPGRDLNRTVVHEMGHHLSLWHTFANTTSCSSEVNCSSQGDEVCDTPATVQSTSCSETECEGQLIENYMDYSPQECKNMYTEGQRTRMRACLESVRSSLLESLGGLPVTEYDLTVTHLSNLGESTCLPSLSPTVVLTNLGVETVEGFELVTHLNGHDPIRTTYSASIASGENHEVTLPELALGTGSNTLSVEVKLPGNQSDDFTDNDTFSQTIELAESDYWTLDLNADMWANEISWRLEDESGNLIMSGGDYPTGMNDYVYEACVPLGCHTLIFEDSNDDGLCSIDFDNDGVCDIGGSMTLTNSAGDVLALVDNTNSNYGSYVSWEVCASEVAVIEGCDDANNNGICDAAEIAGCQDATACNYNPQAIMNDGSCTYAETYYQCDGSCELDTDGDGICDPLESEGCTQANACNYVASATEDDGSCEFTSCSGCLEPEACNYDAEATISAGCNYPETGYDCAGECVNDSDGDGICNEFEIPGCTDVAACNYNPQATDNNNSTCEFAEEYYSCDGSCESDIDGDGICDQLEVAGCTNSNACNYNAQATDEAECEFAETYYDCNGTCLNDTDGDGICNPFEVPGCDDEAACNYEAAATDNDGTCTYPETYYTCEGCINDVDMDGVCDELEVAGCTDQGANNYTQDATDDNGTCTYDTFGCMDESACNFNPFATQDTGNCTYSASYYECNGTCTNDVDGDGVCDELEIPGCNEEDACNYEPSATDNDGSCEFAATYYDCNGECVTDHDGDDVCDEFEIPGCDDEAACNFEPNATDNDGSCEFAEPNYDCNGNCLNDVDGDGICDEVEAAGCTDSTACNFDATATQDDGSCTFPEAGYDCQGNCLNDADGDGICDEAELAGCTDELACNYDDTATDDDGTCEYPAPGEDCGTDNVGDFHAAPVLNLFPNPMSPEHSMVYVSGLDNPQTPIRVLASDGRVAWQGTGIVSSPGVVGFPIRESISPGTYFIQVDTSTPSGNIPLMVW